MTGIRWYTITGVVAVIAVSSAGGTEPARESPSLVINGGFEEGKGTGASGWSFSIWPRPETTPLGGAIGRSNARARTGSWSLRIDTGPFLGATDTLCFNGEVVREAVKLRGRRLDFSGWVYVESGTAVRPIQVTLRCWGKDEKGKSVYAGGVFSTHILGRPGEWSRFRASGTAPDVELSHMDLHCGIRPDAVRTVQYLDDLRLEAHAAPPLEIRPLSEPVWRDDSCLALEVRAPGAKAAAGSLVADLLDARDASVVKWDRLTPSGVLGLPLPKTRLPEGTYTLRVRMPGADGQALAASAKVELVASPWEEMPQPPATAARTPDGPAAEAFGAMGTITPTESPDALPDQAEPLAEGIVSPEDRNRGYVVFQRHPLETVSRSGRPRPGEMETVRLFGAQGQYLPAAVAVWAIKPMRKVVVSVGGLRGPEGAIPAADIDVRVVRMLRGLPAFLEKRPAVDIPADQTQAFRLTVHVPPAAKPGLYAGQADITADGAEPGQMKLLVRVLPMALPPVSKGYGFWWKMDGRWAGYYSKDRAVALEQIRKQFVLLREYGCNMVSIYGMPRMTRAKDGTVTYDFGRDHFGHDAFSLDDLVRLGLQTKLFRPEVPVQYAGADSLHSGWVSKDLGLDPNSAEFDLFYREACKRIDQWARQQGIHLAFACVDEIGNAEQRVQTALRFYRLAKDAGALTSVTDNSMHGGVHLAGQKRFDDIIDMRVYNFILPEMIEGTRRSGDRLWLYNLGSRDDLCRNRLVFGLFAERCGADGVAQWAFQWPKDNLSPYEAAAAGKPAGYHYALPGPDGPLPTLAMEAIRDGIDDARYFALVRKLAPDSPAARLDTMEPCSTLLDDLVQTHTGRRLDAWRWKAARAVMGKTP